MRERHWIALIVSLYATLGLGYSVLIPIWEAPDEPDHYRYALHVAREGSLPSRSASREAAQPPVYYWLASRVLLLLDAADSKWASFYRPPTEGRGVPRYHWGAENYRFLVGPHLLRWINVGLGALTALLIYRGARRFAPDAADIPLATMALAVLSPQFLHTSASVSNDPLANLAGACLFWQMGRVCAGSPRSWELWWVAISAVGLPLLTKLTVLPMSVAALLTTAWQMRARWRPMLLGGLLLALLAIAGFAFLLPVAAERLWRTFAWRSTAMRPLLEVFTQHLPYLVRSYWGFLGWASVPLPWALVSTLTTLAGVGGLAYLRLLLWKREAIRLAHEPLVLLAFAVAILLAAALNTWTANFWVVAAIAAVSLSFRSDRALPGTRAGWSTVAIAVALALVAVGRNALATGATQGRLLFASTGAISLLVASGWWVLAPSRASHYLPHLVVFLMVSVNLYLWLFRLVPIYHQPFLD